MVLFWFVLFDKQSSSEWSEGQGTPHYPSHLSFTAVVVFVVACSGLRVVGSICSYLQNLFAEKAYGTIVG